MYEQFFGFTVSPFASNPDPRIFYFNPVYEAASTKLRHGLVTRCGVMLLTGPAGTGKTALVSRLFDDLGPEFKSIWCAAGGSSIVSILHAVLAELQSTSTTNESTVLMDKLYSCLISSDLESTIITLIIEEAERLDEETIEGLRKLSNLEAHGRKLLQLVLVGEPQLLQTLEQPENYRFKQRMALHCRLFPLTRSELERYILFRLQAAGRTGASPFDAQAFARIARHSDGIPRLVNVLCDKALLAAYRRSKQDISGSIIDQIADEIGSMIDRSEIKPSKREANRPKRKYDDETQTVDVSTAQLWAKNTSAASAAGRAARSSVITLLALMTFAGAGLALYSGDGVTLAKLFKPEPHPLNEEARPVVRAKPQTTESIPQAKEFASQDPAAQSLPVPENEPSAPVRQPELNGNATKHQSDSPPAANVRQRPLKDPAEKKHSLRVEVQRAIENRAIRGVSVRVSDRTVYLQGRVASERQKALAEKAALSVRDTLRVENHIAVENSK